MRYLVTGAAGFIGSHLSEALREEGHDVVGLDCFTDYYDVALKEENARGLDIRRVDLARDPIDLEGIDGVFHLAGQPGVRSFGDVFETYLERNVLASQRLFEAAARDGVRVVFASSSSIYGEAEAYPTAEDVAPRPVSPYGITKLTCEHLARATARSFGAGRRRAPLLQRLRPAAAAGHGVHAHRDVPRRRPPVRPLRRRPPVAQLHVRRRRRPRRRSRRWRGAAARTTSAAVRRRRCSRRSRSSRSSPAAASRSASHPAVPGRPAPHEGRYLADPGRARLGADDDACARVSRPSGSGPLLGSRRDERRPDRPIPTPSGRSTSAPPGRGSRRAGGCRSRGS